MHRYLVLVALVLSLLALGAGPLTAPAAAAAPAYPEVVFILDASGSMWGQVGGTTKIAAAKEVLAQAVPALPPEVRVGLVAYGHRKKGDCADVEVLVAAGSSDREGLVKKAAGLSPKGKTPLAQSITLTAESLKQKENQTTIVLISDGIETCHDDPCGAVKALKETGIKFVLHVVGFGVDPKATEQLQCLASAAGGSYFAAADAAGLKGALEEVRQEVAVEVEEAKTTTVKAVSKLGKLRITMPASAVKSLAAINLMRLEDEKLVKEAKPAADSVHPLMAGKYIPVLALANPNYKPPTEVALGQVTIKGGETSEIKLGAVVFNRAPALAKATQAVSLIEETRGQELFKQAAHGNDYYLWKPKPVPAGKYRLALTYAAYDKAYTVAGDIVVAPGQEAVVTLDSGLALKKAEGVQGWDVYPTGENQPILEVRRRWDNEYPLWESFPLPPGGYDIKVRMKGMDEPLAVGQDVEIKKGQLVVFDAGL